MADGQGCKCYAYCESECCCGADWTPKEVYVLRTKIAKMKKQFADLAIQFRSCSIANFEGTIEGEQGSYEKAATYQICAAYIEDLLKELE